MIKYTHDARGQMVAVYEDGTVVPVLGAEQSVPQASNRSQPAPVTSEDATSTSSPDAGYARNSGYSRNYSRNYSPRQPNFGSDFPTTPEYADGSRHPAQGGFPRTPGGQAAQQSENGGRGQQQVSVPGGAAAGPFSTRAAYSPDGPGASGGSPRGGGGGGPSAVYNAWKAKLEGKLMPGSSSPYESGAYSSFEEPKERKEPMRGPYAHGLDPDQALGLAMRPAAMLGRSMPGLDDDSPLYGRLASMPAYELGVLSKRGYKGRPMDLANSIGRFQHAAGTTGDLPDFETVFNNLTNPRKHGGFAQIFSGVKAPKAVQKSTGYEYEYGKSPLAAADAATTYENFLGGALSLLPSATAAKYSLGASRLIDQATLKAMKKPAGKGKPIYRSVGRKLFS